MGQRLLEINVKVMLSVLSGLGSGPGRYFTVDRDHVPEDATVVSLRPSPYWPDTVEVLLESSSWAPAAPRTRLETRLTLHRLPKAEAAP